MKQAKKIFTRMLISNWGGIDHKIIEFHEHVNLFSGKSGSGKSTVMDAMQVVLYGSVRNDFLNRAADDTKNKRSVLSYLKGAQKDGTSNRENQDFYAQIVLELFDTTNKSSVCVGAAFEVGRNDLDLKKYSFFSHIGKFPEDEYLTERGIPYSLDEIKKLIGERSLSKENKGRINLNRIYPSNEAYLNALNELIFGYVDAGRFKTMQKSAIALKMSNGTSQFIKDYMFPKSKEDTISAISEQLGAYREIKEQVEVLEKEIEMLTEVQVHDRALVQAQVEQVRNEEILKILNIEDKKAHLSSYEEELKGATKKITALKEKIDSFKTNLNNKRDELTKVQVEIKSSGLERKKEELVKVNELIQSCANEASDWRNLVKRLKMWDETDGINDYVSNSVLHLLEDIWDGDITETNVTSLKKGLEETYNSLKEVLDDLKSEYREALKDYTEKKDILNDLKSDKKHYKKELKEVRHLLQQKLSDRYGRTIHVEVLADLFDITDETWRDAIEGRLGRIKYGLVVEPRYAIDAAKIFRQMKKQEYEMVDLINTAAIQRDNPTAESGTLYECVSTENPYVNLCLKRYLGHIKKCETVEELHEVKNGVTKDCYSYSNYMFSHLKQQDYKYQTIGKKISQKQIRELEDEVHKLSEQLIALEQEIAVLNQGNDFERLKDYDYERILRLSQAGEKLRIHNQEATRLQEEIRELEKGTLIEKLQKQEADLKEVIESLEQEIEKIRSEKDDWIGSEILLNDKILNIKEELDKLLLGFVPNKSLVEEIEQVIKEGKVPKYKKETIDNLEKAKEEEEREANSRTNTRMKYIHEFPMRDFGGMEKSNDVYDARLEQCKKDFEPKYKAEFDKQYQLVYQMLRENVIATIHSEIKSAKRHRREINAMLEKIRFSDSIYQIDILPVDDENKYFYDMLTAEELDMKVINQDVDGQISFGEDEFYQKYEQQILRLTDKFMPPKDADQSTRTAFKKNMEKYADYRTYLNFSMYEKTIDADGNVKKNYVDDMAGRDSGGEGQNPKYVALLAGFAMLYMQQSNRDSKIRLVLLDEAFSKMDKERSEVCLHYARQLGLQLVVCVPDERLQSLIQNVDCVYAFRRANNRISMIHIDKGDYFKMIEGDADEESDDVVAVVDSENK